MSDSISREEVLRAIITAGEIEPDLGYTHLHKVIENLPSADIEEDVARRIATIIENEQDMRVILKNAEPKTVFIDGIGHFPKVSATSQNLTKPHKSCEDDLISRQDVVNEIHKYFVEEIDKTPTEIDEDGDELYADMPTVNSLLACNKELSKRIKALPSAEAVEVVRCKDCKWYGHIGCAIEIKDDSDRPKPDDFCSFGERRTK